MRLAWTFFLGMLFAAYVMLVTVPLLALGGAVVAWFKRPPVYNALAGESVFGLTERDGRLDGRLVNVNFHTPFVTMAGEPRPKRILVRLEVINGDVFGARPGEGRIRLDGWSMDSAADLGKPSLYTTVAPGRGAAFAEDGTLWVDHGGGRRSVYNLANGEWLFDTDMPPATFLVEAEKKRQVALSAAEDDMPPLAVAAISYAAGQTVLRRVMMTVNDPARARLLRSSISMVRPVVRLEDTTRRVLELGLPAGVVRIPIVGDDLDLAHAQTPLGVFLSDLKAWKIPQFGKERPPLPDGR